MSVIDLEQYPLQNDDFRTACKHALDQLSGDQISDISGLFGLTNLTRLHLHNNKISDVSPLSGLTHLTELFLAYNQIIGP